MKPFWRLMALIKPYQTLVGLSILSNILMSFFTVISIPLIIPFFQILFDREPATIVRSENPWDISNQVQFFFSQLLENQGKSAALLYVCGSIIVVFFLKNIFRYLALFFMAPVRNGMIRDLRLRLFEKFNQLKLGFYTEGRKGDLITRMSGDIQEIEISVIATLDAVFKAPLIIIGSIIFMIYISPALTLFVLVLMIFTTFIIGGISRTLKRNSKTAQNKLGLLVSMVEETIGGIRIIKAFNAESFQIEKFKQVNNKYKDIITRILWRKDLSSPLSEFLGITIVSVLLYYGSNLVFSGKLIPETFFAFIFAFYQVIEPSKLFSSSYYRLQKGLAAVERVEEIIRNDEVEIQEKTIETVDFKSNIHYKNISFKFTEGGDWILKDIDIEIKKGEIVAFVGSSGAGKSTLVDLLPRFYESVKGEILIDSVPITSYSVSAIRNIIGMVSQEAILFNDTIYNNIVFGASQFSKEQVMEAARIANAHEFIMETQQGYETMIGDRGMKLSGGQRQRLTIARAILRNPPILILDEATSALDAASEKSVQEALEKVMQKRTSLVVAHRLSTIQHADRIYVLEQGKVVQFGRHEELISVEGPYRDFVKLQTF